MEKITCLLFDMDGVMLDTESQYDIFWKRIGKEYNIGISNFEKKIKGTTLPGILKKYFSDLPSEETEKLIAELDKFESQMEFYEIAGSVDFVKRVKAEGFKVGLVTSSTNTKMIGVNKNKHFDTLFDTLVTASQVEHGKPNPECYLLAAKKLSVNSEQCLVFEDSFAGITAAKAAGMDVIGLATTHSHKELENKGCYKIINNFNNISIKELLN